MDTAGVRGKIERYVTTINSPSTIYHFYEMKVERMEADWQESRERIREWFTYEEARRRVGWKPELREGLDKALMTLPS